jgi:hypothetical protein
MFWVLAGLVLFSILMGSITNALTTVTFASKTIQLYGTKVAAIHGSPSYRVGIRRNAKVNQGWCAECEIVVVVGVGVAVAVAVVVVVVVVVVFLKLLMTSLSHFVLQAWRTHLTKQCSTNTKRLQQLKQQGRYAQL